MPPQSSHAPPPRAPRCNAPFEDQPYGERSGTIKDPFGHRWMIATLSKTCRKSELQRRVGDAYKIT